MNYYDVLLLISYPAAVIKIYFDAKTVSLYLWKQKYYYTAGVLFLLLNKPISSVPEGIHVSPWQQD